MSVNSNSVSLSKSTYEQVNTTPLPQINNNQSNECSLLQTCFTRAIRQQKLVPSTSIQITPSKNAIQTTASNYSEEEILKIKAKGTPNRGLEFENGSKIIKRNTIKLSAGIHNSEADEKIHAEQAITYTISENGWLEIWNAETSSLIHQFFICPFKEFQVGIGPRVAQIQTVNEIIDVQEIGSYLCIYGKNVSRTIRGVNSPDQKRVFVIDLRGILTTGNYSKNPINFDFEENNITNRYIANDRLFLFKNNLHTSTIFAFRLDPEDNKLKQIWKYDDLKKSCHSTHTPTDSEREDYWWSSDTILVDNDHTNSLIRSNDKFILFPVKLSRENHFSLLIGTPSYYHTTRFLTLLNIESGKEEVVHLLSSTRNFPQYLQLHNNIIVYQKDYNHTSSLLNNMFFVHPSSLNEELQTKFSSSQEQLQPIQEKLRPINEKVKTLKENVELLREQKRSTQHNSPESAQFDREILQKQQEAWSLAPEQGSLQYQESPLKQTQMNLKKLQLEGTKYKLRIKGHTQKVTFDFNRQQLILKILYTPWNSQMGSVSKELVLSSKNLITSKLTRAKNATALCLGSLMKNICMGILSNFERYDSNRKDDEQPSF